MTRMPRGANAVTLHSIFCAEHELEIAISSTQANEQVAADTHSVLSSTAAHGSLWCHAPRQRTQKQYSHVPHLSFVRQTVPISEQSKAPASKPSTANTLHERLKLRLQTPNPDWRQGWSQHQASSLIDTTRGNVLPSEGAVVVGLVPDRSGVAPRTPIQVCHLRK